MPEVAFLSGSHSLGLKAYVLTQISMDSTPPCSYRPLRKFIDKVVKYRPYADKLAKSGAGVAKNNKNKAGKEIRKSICR